MESSRRDEAEENLAPPFDAFGGHSSDAAGYAQQPPAQFECPICLHWLREPVITACGHRFCRDCIGAWLRQGKHCPVDNVALRDVDLFPDNYTRREIQQQRTACPNAARGCEARVGPHELDAHVALCRYSLRTPQASPKPEVKCAFRALGCTTSFAEEAELAKHAESHTQRHLNLLMAAYSKLAVDRDIAEACSGSAKECEATTLWDPDQKRSSSTSSEGASNGGGEPAPAMSPRALTRALYERIVVLEQRNHEQDIAIGNLSRSVAALTSAQRQTAEDLALKHCFGAYAWKIENATLKLETMLKDASKILYSQGFYASPSGYKFCMRLNRSPLQSNHFALHVHMMKSENDDCLEWPFAGKISLALINPTFPQFTQRDVMEAKPDLAAFQRPTAEMSPRGFGFASYISYDDVKLKGFVVGDQLKVFVKIFKH